MDKTKPPAALEKDLPGYRVESVLGSGATSTVYRAVQTSLGRFVAVKRFDPSTFLPEAVASRFEREAAIWSHLSHENLIHLYDYKLTDQARYIILEYCHGIELREAIAQVMSFPPTVVAAVAHQLLFAVEYLHRYGVVHRDLKPANIFLTHLGVVKLMDFGISLCPELEPITGPGQVIGTPAYMAPEQVMGKGADERSDFFSIGVVLYELLEGVKPLKPLSIEQMAKDKNYWKVKKLRRSHPSVLRDFIHTCLAIKPEKRRISVSKQKHLLERYLQREKVSNPKDHIRDFLQQRGLVTEMKSLFWLEAIKETTGGPLGTTYAQLIPDEAKKGGRLSFRTWLILIFMVSVILGAYFGPWPVRPDWETLFRFLYDSIKKWWS